MVAVLASAALAAALFVAGCGSSGNEARPTSQSQPAGGGGQASGDSDQSASSSQSSHTGSGSDQSSSINSSSSGGSSSSSTQSSSSGGVSNFSGAGATTLSFNVERPSRLVWTNSEGKRFTAKGAGISIASDRGRGEVDLRPGNYNDVKVDGDNWTLLVRPR